MFCNISFLKQGQISAIISILHTICCTLVHETVNFNHNLKYKLYFFSEIFLFLIIFTELIFSKTFHITLQITDLVTVHYIILTELKEEN